MTRPHDPVAMRVVTFLGLAALVGLLVAGILCYYALTRQGNEQAAVVVAIVGNLASAALASLGSILASTRGSSTPTPVEVTNSAAEPVPTVPQTPSAFAVGDPAAPLKES